jgi:hypothetical protein
MISATDAADFCCVRDTANPQDRSHGILMESHAELAGLIVATFIVENPVPDLFTETPLTEIGE